MCISGNVTSFAYLWSLEKWANSLTSSPCLMFPQLILAFMCDSKWCAHLNKCFWCQQKWKLLLKDIKVYTNEPDSFEDFVMPQKMCLQEGGHLSHRELIITRRKWPHMHCMYFVLLTASQKYVVYIWVILNSGDEMGRRTKPTGEQTLFSLSNAYMWNAWYEPTCVSPDAQSQELTGIWR